MTMRCMGRRLNLGAIAILIHPSRFSLVSSFGRNPSFQSAVVSRRSSLFSSSSSSSSTASSTDMDPTKPPSAPLKVLALHGSGGTAQEFPSRLVALQEALAVHSQDSIPELAITSVQAPFVKEEGFSWWTMPPGVRSFNAETYTGFEESAQKVLQVWDTGGFDLVVGHSQGAILVGALLALQRTPYHPPRGYILNGVSFPNPYSHELESLRKEDTDDDVLPRILFLLGKTDRIAPNATGEKLRDLLQQGGFAVSSCYHEGGHGFPQEDANDTTMTTIAEWILEGQTR